jgi:mannitol-1-phosphate 5-dehydrogenase
MRITIIGAGKTGRGFLARLLKNQEVDIIDKNPQLINYINKQGYVEIYYFGNKKPAEKITVNSAKTWDDVVKIESKLILISVGGTNLADVGKELSTRITKDTKIIVCENASNPAQKLYNAIGIEGLEIAESTVFCTTIEKEGIDINSEWYPYLQYDAERFTNRLSEIDGLKPIIGFGNFLNRKLYTYNSASCIIAYLGYLKDYTVYSDAANDKEILEMLDKNYEIINRCLCKEYGYDEVDQKEFAELSRAKFTDKTLVDTVARNAREPQRKITKLERIVAPLLLEEKYGEDTTVLEKTLASMLLYTPDTEIEWKEILKDKGYEGVLIEFADLEKNSKIYNRVLELANHKREII